VAVSWRNLSTLGSAAAAQARAAFDSALGTRIGEPAAEAQITISENATAYLLVEEFRKGDDRQVWMASWKRAATTSAPPVTIEKRLLWEQDEPILDAAPAPDSLYVLTPTAVIRVSPRQTAPIAASRPWPRDLRGHIRLNGAGLQVYLPGLSCSGTLEPLTVTCKPSDESWTIESGSRALLLANFAAGRNFFDGRVMTQSGARKTIAPFYSAAAADAFWILATTDGRAEIYDGAMERVGTAGLWGSDVAGVDTRCGGAPIVLATRPGEGPDAVQAYAIVNRTAVAAGAAAEMPGPVTALWSPGVAIVRTGGRYQAYALTVSCAQ
jgi:hypothetical protein